MSNPMKDYVDNFRANLPSGVTYDSDIARYSVNNKRFLNEWEAERYNNYIQKFASEPPAPVAGASATDFSDTTSGDLTPIFHLHPNTSSMTNFAAAEAQDGDTVTEITDLRGLANGAQTVEDDAPFMVVDKLGRKTLVLAGTRHMIVDSTFPVLQPDDWTIVCMVRMHRSWGTVFQAKPGDDSEHVLLRADRPAGDSVGFWKVSNGSFSRADPTNPQLAYASAAPSVVGQLNISTGVKWWIDGTILTAGSSTQFGAGNGAVLGARWDGTAGEVIREGAGQTIYEIAVWDRALTQAEFEAAAQKMQDNWQVVPKTRQIVLEGDSITQTYGFGDLSNGVRSDGNPASLLSDPGAGYIPDDVRVLAAANGGARVGYSGDSGTNTVYYRLNVANSYADFPFPGGPSNNIAAIQIGANDFIDTEFSVFYSRLLALYGDTPDGFIGKGFTVQPMANILRGITANTRTRTQELHTKFANDLLTDMNAGPGGVNEGLVLPPINLHQITVDGQTVFLTQEDTQDLTYYLESESTPGTTDRTHPSAEGARVMVSGGDTPQNGYGAIL